MATSKRTLAGAPSFASFLAKGGILRSPNESINLAGQHTSSFDVINHWENEGWAYWGAAPVSFYAGGITQFDHQDWLGTERMRTRYDGSIEGTFTSLPFGSGSGTSGTDWDQYHFAGLDHDYGSNTDHAQYRQYANASGRWTSPDPFSGSYDFSNPQSLNRYAYVGNNTLSMTDRSGLMNCPDVPCGGGDGSGGHANNPSNSPGWDWISDWVNALIFRTYGDGAYDGTYWQWEDLGHYVYGGSGVQPGGSAPNSGPSYSHADVCAASALLNRGGQAALDAIGILPALGSLGKGVKIGIQVVQHAAGLGSLALTVFGGSSPGDAVFTGTDLGVTAVDDAKVMTEGAALVP